MDRSARVWSVADGQDLQRMSHSAEVADIDISPDGKPLATASWNQTARIWDIDTGRELTRITHDGRLYVVAFSPDGRLRFNQRTQLAPRHYPLHLLQEQRTLGLLSVPLKASHHRQCPLLHAGVTLTYTRCGKGELNQSLPKAFSQVWRTQTAVVEPGVVARAFCSRLRRIGRHTSASGRSFDQMDYYRFARR